MTAPPKWFQEWRDNHFNHLVKDVWWIKVLVIGVTIAVIAAAICEKIF